MTDRFDLPSVSAATPVRFPPIVDETLPSGLRVWIIEAASAPVASTLLVVPRGTSADPIDAPGLAGFAADILDEGAGDRDAIALADAFARLGTQLEIEVGADITTFGLTTVARAWPDALALVSDVVQRPRFEPADVERVRELRVNRLKQISRSAGAAADRALLKAVFRDHPYGHGALGTTKALLQMSADAARGFWSREMGPSGATLIVAGDVIPREVVRHAERLFGRWSGGRPRVEVAAPTPPRTAGAPHVILVDRPGAPQSEVRVGHVSPPRTTPDYHALVTLNAVLGGQFSSRLNRNLRESRGVTYGARSGFEFRRAGGYWSADTSVQADATTTSGAEILRECREIRRPGAVAADELELAKGSLTRGYVRHFETAAHLARAASVLAVHSLGPETFDDFVDAITAVGADALGQAAERHLHPDGSTVVIVGDAEHAGALAERVGPVEMVTPEF